MTNDKSLIINKPQAHVTELLINRPKVSNAFDSDLLKRLHETFEHIAQDTDCRVVLIRSKGKHFSAGADLAWMQRTMGYTAEENENDAKLLSDALHALDTLPQVTLAQVHGAAMGGALGIIACCDLSVASSESFFAFSEVKMGLIPAVICPYVIRAMGAKAARHWMLTAERFGSVQAIQLQLINAVVESDDLDNQTQGWIQAIVNNAPQAVRITKQLIREVITPISDPIRQHTIQTIAQARVGEEAQRGLQAFLKKQKPPWSESN